MVKLCFLMYFSCFDSVSDSFAIAHWFVKVVQLFTHCLICITEFVHFQCKLNVIGSFTHRGVFLCIILFMHLFLLVICCLMCLTGIKACAVCIEAATGFSFHNICRDPAERDCGNILGINIDVIYRVIIYVEYPQYTVHI